MPCTDCDGNPCSVGRVDKAPAYCPMHGSGPGFAALYSSKDARLLTYHSTLVEAAGYCRWTRLREVMELARIAELRHLGVAHCADTRAEAESAAARLREHGLRVSLRAPSSRCDPILQARQFTEARTDFNIMVGMCVGHDALFIRHSAAPITSLVVRDLRLRHNPVGAIYNRRGYFREALYKRTAPGPAQPFHGLDDETLEHTAELIRLRTADSDKLPCRIEEVMDFCNLAGIQHLGMVFCIGLRREAQDLAAILRANHFTVSSICCKTGSVPKEELAIRDEEKVRPGTPEMICNPLAQAEAINGCGAQVALLVGQCVGHDSATMARLRVPAVCVVAKDRVLAHNTVAALGISAQENRDA